MTPASTLHRRDVLSAVLMWLEDASLDDVTVLPPDARWPTDHEDAVASVRLSGLQDAPRGGQARGELLLDIGSSRVDPVTPTILDGFLRANAIGDLKAALQGQNIPLFAHRAADALSRAGGTTSGVLAQGASSVLVTGGAAFQETDKTILVGSELMTWTGKADAGSDATFSGLTRGQAKTVDKAHPSGTSVRDAPGDPIAFMEVAESEEDDLGWDVAAQRFRALLRVGFRVDFAS